jgi:hypothetical protein
MVQGDLFSPVMTDFVWPQAYDHSMRRKLDRTAVGPPVVLFTIAVQRYLIRGLTFGAVKG